MKRCLNISIALSLILFSSCASSPVQREIAPADRARLMLEMANSSLLEGDVTGALQTLIDAQHIAPDLPELHHSKALAYHLKGDAQNAVEEARIAVQLNPKYSDANNTLGKLLMDQGKQEESIVFLNRAAKDPLYRESFKPLTNLGILYYRSKNFAQSKEALDRAILSSRESACIAYYYRGHLALREQRFTDAIHDYKQASHGLCAAFADAHLALGKAYEDSGRVDQARKVFVEIQDHFPSTEASAKALKSLRGLP